MKCCPPWDRCQLCPDSSQDAVGHTPWKAGHCASVAHPLARTISGPSALGADRSATHPNAGKRSDVDELQVQTIHMTTDILEPLYITEIRPERPPRGKEG